MRPSSDRVYISIGRQVEFRADPEASSAPSRFSTYVYAKWIAGAVVALVLLGHYQRSSAGEVRAGEWTGAAEKVNRTDDNAFDSPSPSVAVSQAAGSPTPPARIPAAAVNDDSTPKALWPTAQLLNVHPSPFTPSTPRDRYLAYENHSGFSNQRISLINALVLAELLNRTLLIPPARLGHAQSFNDKLNARITGDERCKKDPGSWCRDPDGWTYVSWPFLLRSSLFEGRRLVDRWDSNMKWFTRPLDQGGLGVAADGVRDFKDATRRDRRFYDTAKSTKPLGKFERKVNIEDLKREDAEVLHFGSLFGHERLALEKKENVKLWKRVERSMVLGNPRLGEIVEVARAKLGSDYVAVHLRVGDGSFKIHAAMNVDGVFRAILRKLEVPTEIVDSLYDASSPAFKNAPGRKPTIKQLSPLGDAASPNIAACSFPRYDEPSPLQRLNTPLYIATDSHHPRRDPNLALFFRYFPCTFTLNDFVGEDDLTGRDWKSDWDGLDLKRHVLPFIDAEIAARASVVVGTPGSTFSSYTVGVLHNTFLKEESSRNV